MARNNTDVASTLVDLGFSEYEARTYVGLVGREPVTGYAVAKATGVPQPKVYETLDRLAERGAIVLVGRDPATWVAVPPAGLLSRIEGEFRHKLTSAELKLSQLNQGTLKDEVRPLWGSGSWERILGVATDYVSKAVERIYISAHHEQLRDLRESLSEADARGVRCDVLSFGDPEFDLEHGTVVQHKSTEGLVFPHHQARHLALASDADMGLWALARSGDDWESMWAVNDLLVPALIKGYVRHDLHVQRIYADVGPTLHEVYGPGLEGIHGLVDDFRDDESSDAVTKPA